MFHSIVAALGLGLLVPVCALQNVRQLYQFPNDKFHDIENVAIRPNGQLLLNTITEPVTYILDPASSNPQATVLYQFPGYTGLAGIAELSPDVFALVVGNYSVAEFKGIPGSFAIWTINLTSGHPVAKKVASIPEAQTFNGLTALSSSLILVADSAVGSIYSVNINTGAYKVTIQDAKFQPSSQFPLGVNGIHYKNSVLYYTNSAQGTFGKVPITSSGTASGPFSVIANAPTGSFYDDFALDMFGNALITAHSNSIVKVVPIGGAQITIANSTSIIQPTAAVFGNNAISACTLYVVTAGQVSGSTIASGQVLAVTAC